MQTSIFTGAASMRFGGYTDFFYRYKIIVALVITRIKNYVSE